MGDAINIGHSLNEKSTEISLFNNVLTAFTAWMILIPSNHCIDGTRILVGLVIKLVLMVQIKVFDNKFKIFFKSISNFFFLRKKFSKIPLSIKSVFSLLWFFEKYGLEFTQNFYFLQNWIFWKYLSLALLFQGRRKLFMVGG